MASLLRQLIAGPRVKHADSNLDLCYVTPFLIATSGPSGTYPQRAYRNPLDQLVAFLDRSHGEEWCIWEFRAEGTGYPDSEVRGKVRHYPWPDHHPPPFGIVPLVMAGMRNWLLEGVDHGEGKTGHAGKEGTRLDERHAKGRVVVVHCKAGKGRSGTIASSYLISECGWTKDEALARFTERRMRPGFGQGVSIRSQLRWIDYVARWTNGGKKYTERPVEILEIHVWGLREGVKVAVEGYIEEGKKIKTFHVFGRRERLVVEGNTPGGAGFKDWIQDMANPAPPAPAKSRTIALDSSSSSTLGSSSGASSHPKASDSAAIQGVSEGKEVDPEAGGQAVMFRPTHPLIVPSTDVNIDFERRNKAKYGMTMVTSVAHVWFNPFFEGNGPEQGGAPDETGVFEIEWEGMDGIKGSLRKGTRALDRLAVVWRFAGEPRETEKVIEEPAEGAEVPEMQAADWKGGKQESPEVGRDLGLRAESPATADVSKASSLKSRIEEAVGAEETDDDLKGVKSSGPAGEEEIKTDQGDVDAKGERDLAKPTDEAKEPTLEAPNEALDGASSTTPLRGSTT